MHSAAMSHPAAPQRPPLPAQANPLQEADALHALTELFPHLKLAALVALRELFPVAPLRHP